MPFLNSEARVKNRTRLKQLHTTSSITEPATDNMTHKNVVIAGFVRNSCPQNVTFIFGASKTWNVERPASTRNDSDRDRFSFNVFIQLNISIKKCLH